MLFVVSMVPPPRFHRDVMDRYCSFSRSFIDIDDARIEAAPQYECRLKTLFAGFRLYRHQEEALRLGASGRGFVGTSATMAGGDTSAERNARVADAASAFFGDAITPDRVIEESVRAHSDGCPDPEPVELARSGVACAAVLKNLFQKGSPP